MKLSFSLSTKPSSSSSKPQPNRKPPSDNFTTAEESSSAKINKEYVTEFDSSKTPEENKSKKVIIPPKPNEWRPHKKMKNLDLPTAESDCPTLNFTVESQPTADSDNNMSYGLNLRDSTKAEKMETDDGGDDDRTRAGVRSIDSAMLQSFRDDMRRLPEDRGFEEFEDMPVEGFGAALLAGYGWVEGRGIGRNNPKEDVKIVQFERRTNKEGLGFVSDMMYKNNSNSRNNNNGNVAANDSSRDDGGKKKVKEAEKISNNRIHEEGRGARFYVPGKEVRIVGGRDYVGMKGRVVEVSGELVVLRILKKRDEEGEVRARVRIQDIADLGSVEEDRCLRKLEELKIQGGSSDEVGGGGRAKDGYGSRGHKGGSRREEDRKQGGRRGDRREEEKSSKKSSWLISHIRVRVISKELKGGRLYLKKGKVLDVVGPTTCDISMDESGELIQGVDQVILETALPRRGGPVMVLSGKHKGVFGNLVERDAENETGIVRDADSHALLNVRLEQVAEYIGDPSYIGY